MVMHGFKSFAKYTEIDFNSDFNCVLGPNGSGKSNVLDALCFVLGKSSAKSMRAEKSSNLIYNGGKSKKPAKQGMVSIFFDNKNKVFPTEDNEVKITRVVRQNGQSIYKINDETRTRQEILDLLNMGRIDPDGYNIILQGDIVKFVEMPPVERRMLIEDISGISVYEEKKNKALSNLEKVDTRLKEAGIILTERNTYLKELKKDRDQALKFKEMNDNIRANKASLLKIQIDKKEKESNELKLKRTSGEEELAKIQGKIDGLKKSNDEKRQAIEDITKEIEEKGEVEQVNLNREIESMKIELTKNRSRVDVCKTEVEKINKRVGDLASSLKGTKDKIDSLEEEKQKLEEERAKNDNEKKGLLKKVTDFKDKNNLDNIGNIEKDIEEIDQKADELQKKIHILRENQHGLIRKNDIIQHEINTIDEKVKKVEEIERENKDQLDNLKEMRAEFKRSTLELNKLLDEDSTLSARVGGSRDKLTKTNEELAKLRAKELTIVESRAGDIATKKILERKGNGVYGTVAELGEVNSKYALALEIAAGPRLKSIVVEDDRVASECIRYLKQNRLGVATFLPLNKVKHNKIDPEVTRLAKSKGSHGLAMDLVEFDNKFKKVFQYVFANTLVVDNIDVARRLGIGNAKMATLDGDITTFSGVMRGGYRGRKKEGMGFKEKDVMSNINKYEQMVAELENNIYVMEKRRKTNEEKITALREKKAQLEGEIIKVEKSLHLEPTDLEASKIQKESKANELKSNEEEINKIQMNISEVNKELANIKIEKQKLRSKISELRDPALIAELTTFEEKIRNINEETVRIDSEIKNIMELIASIHAPEIAKTDSIIKQLEKEEKEFKEELGALLDSIKRKEEVLMKKEGDASVFYAKFKELFVKRTKVNEEIQKNDILINNKSDDARKVEIRNNTLSLKNAELASILAGLKQEFDQYEGVTLITNKTEDQIKYEIAKFEKLRNEIGAVNMRALEIYEEVEKEYQILLKKKETLGSERDDVMKLIQEIEGKKKGLFMKTFDVITKEFQNTFNQLTTKGSQAYLELENPENPFEAGVRVKVKISSQKFLDIRSLSGGEKTLTALAFIFSIQEHDPASFYILDEVDAALDKHNSERLANLVKKYSEKAQYIIISHNDGVISTSENLYGVSMNEHGVSKIISLKV